MHLDEFWAVCSSDAVEEQVHRRQPCGVLHQFDSADSAAGHVLGFLGRQPRAVVEDVFVRSEQEFASASSRVCQPRCSGTMTSRPPSFRSARSCAILRKSNRVS